MQQAQCGADPGARAEGSRFEAGAALVVSGSAVSFGFRVSEGCSWLELMEADDVERHPRAAG
jgi:hypothetical protein